MANQGGLLIIDSGRVCNLSDSNLVIWPTLTCIQDVNLVISYGYLIFGLMFNVMVQIIFKLIINR